MFSLTGCLSIQEKKEINVAPQLPTALDEENYRRNSDNGDNMVVVMGDCRHLENNEYCEKEKRREADNKKQLDESLKKHTSKEQ